MLRYGPGGFSTAIPDLVFPNGINVSPDGRTVCVAAARLGNRLPIGQIFGEGFLDCEMAGVTGDQ